MSKTVTRALFYKAGTHNCQNTQCLLRRKCTSCFTMKSCFNKCQSNVIFSTHKYDSGLHQFTVYVYAKMFSFKKYYCNENAIQMPPAM